MSGLITPETALRIYRATHRADVDDAPERARLRAASDYLTVRENRDVVARRATERLFGFEVRPLWRAGYRFVWRVRFDGEADRLFPSRDAALQHVAQAACDARGFV